jgi:glycosyltransferase involved in cell wall biosynthesis
MPVFSVVTPIFNAVRFLPATLDSVARLSVEHEHIVVDGGSADGTVELLESRSTLASSGFPRLTAARPTPSTKASSGQADS